MLNFYTGSWHPSFHPPPFIPQIKLCALFHDYFLSKNIQKGLWAMKKEEKHMLKSMNEKKERIKKK
jgi:hypothetical protein